MKRYLRTLALLFTLAALTGCETATSLGPCVGLLGNDRRNPDLNYEASAKNIVLGIVFAELVAPPVLVLTDQFYCPVSKKSPSSTTL